MQSIKHRIYTETLFTRTVRVSYSTAGIGTADAESKTVFDTAGSRADVSLFQLIIFRLLELRRGIIPVVLVRRSGTSTQELPSKWRGHTRYFGLMVLGKHRERNLIPPQL